MQEAAGLHRQDQRSSSSSTGGVHATAPSPGRHRVQEVPTAPAAAWDSSVERDTNPCSDSLSRAKLGRGMGMCLGVQGVAYEAVGGCMRGDVKLLSYPYFSLPSYIYAGVSCLLTAQLKAAAQHSSCDKQMPSPRPESLVSPKASL